MVALVQYDGFYETHPVFLPLVVVGVHNGKKKVWLNKCEELSLKHIRAQTTVLYGVLCPPSCMKYGGSQLLTS